MDPFELVADVGDALDAVARDSQVDTDPLRDQLADGAAVVEQMAEWRPDIATSCAVVRGVFEQLDRVLDCLDAHDTQRARETFASVLDPKPAPRPRLRLVPGGCDLHAVDLSARQPQIS